MIQKCKNSNFALAPDGIVTQLLLFSCLKTKCILATRLACAICAITLFSRLLSCFVMGPWLPLYTHHPLQPPRNPSFSFNVLSYSGCLFCICQWQSILALSVYMNLRPRRVTLTSVRSLLAFIFCISRLAVPCCVSVKDASISRMVVTVRGEWAREVIMRTGGSHSDPRDDSTFRGKVPDWH